MVLSHGRIAAIVVLAPLAACSLITSLDDLACDGGCDAMTQDAPADTASDASDAAVEASPEASLSFCATAPDGSFCDDFDEAPFGARWKSFAVSDAGSITPSDASWVSPPLSALAQMAANAPTCSAAELFTNFQNVSVMDLDFQLNVPSNFPGAFVTDESGDFAGTSCIYRLVPSGPSGAYVHEELILPDGGVPFWHHPLPSALPAGAWIHVVLSLDFVAHKLAVTTNGITVLQNEPIQPACGPISGAMQTSVGLDCVQPASATVIAQYDNVLIEPH